MENRLVKKLMLVMICIFLLVSCAVFGCVAACSGSCAGGCASESGNANGKGSKTEKETEKETEKDTEKETEQSKNEEITAESLLNAVFSESKELDNAKYSVELILDMDLDLKGIMMESEGLTEQDIQDALDNGEITEEDLAGKISTKLNSTLYCDGDKTYTEGKVEASAMGYDETADVKSYSIKNGNVITTYEYSEEDDEWYVSETEITDDEVSSMGDFVVNFMDIVKEAEIEDVDEDLYFVNVKADFDKLSGILLDDMMSGGYLDAEGTSGELDITLGIDGSNNELISIFFDMTDVLEEALNDSEFSELGLSDYTTINAADFSIFLIEQGKSKVEIPEEVIENAIEKIEVDWEDEEDDWEDEEDDEEILEDDEEESTTSSDKNGLDPSIKQADVKLSSDTTVTLYVPEGFQYSTEYSGSGSFVVFKNGKSVYLTRFRTPYMKEWEETGRVASYEDSGDWEQFSIKKIKVIKTDLGDITLYENTRQLANSEYIHTYYVAEIFINDEAMMTLDSNKRELEYAGIDIESALKEIFAVK